METTKYPGMRHRWNPIVLCTVFVLFLGCQSTRESSYVVEDVNSYRNKRISSVTLKNGESYRYDKVGGRYVEEKRADLIVREIVGFDPSGVAQNFEIARILEVQCQSLESDGSGTILTIVLAVAATTLIVGLLFAAGISRTTSPF